jgi:hypothetical protein
MLLSKESFFMRSFTGLKYNYVKRIGIETFNSSHFPSLKDIYQSHPTFAFAAVGQGILELKFERG